MIPNSQELHYECYNLLKRKSRQKISEEVIKKLNNKDYEFKNSNNYKDSQDDINPFIKLILSICMKINK